MTVLNDVFSRGVFTSFRVEISTFRVAGFVISSFRVALFRLFAWRYFGTKGRNSTNQPPYKIETNKGMCLGHAMQREFIAGLYYQTVSWMTYSLLNFCVNTLKNKGQAI